MIELSVSDGVAEVVLNAPDKLNALDPAALAELSDAYADGERMARAGEIRALVLRGEGRAFCAGRDISGVDPRDDDVLGYLGGIVEPLLRRMAAFPAPDVRGRARRVPRRRARAAHRERHRVRRRHREDRLAVREPRRDPRLGRARAVRRASRCASHHGPHRHRSAHVGRRGGCRRDSSRRSFPADEVTETTRAAARAAAAGATRAFVASKQLVAALRDDRLGLWASMAEREPRAGRALRHGRLSRGLRRVPAEA